MALIALFALIRDTAHQGQDFEVFRRAGEAILQGRSIYDLSGGDGMVFKYPPWIAPLFVPFALLPLAAAKWTWGTVCAFSLIALIHWTLLQAHANRWVALGAVMFWGIWAVHALDGQVMLPIAAAAVWAIRKPTSKGLMVLAWLALTTKIFTLIAVLGAPREMRKPKTFAWALLATVALSLPSIIHEGGVSPLLERWRAAATSGEHYFGSVKVHGRDNQGLPALLRRNDLLPATGVNADLLSFAVIAALLAFAWGAVSRRLGEAERWAGWLAVAAVCHPLAWFHQFVLVFPAATLALDRAARAKNRVALFLAALGLAAVSVVTRKTFGTSGEQLELLSIKSLGTLLCLAVLAATHFHELVDRPNLDHSSN